ncbi:MAG: site-specific DNA-methyltransferase [Limnochordia bacterium]|nr:site-specific DNA-methyltransferase [Limnochordia bacterium]MDD4517672.1 DNA methyltransferase [Limnochordia bacterium]
MCSLAKVKQIPEGNANQGTGYRRVLADYLADPEFMRREGFPQGSAEDILRLSDPPHFTLCPNPFIGEFIGNKKQTVNAVYSKEPFAEDVREGKNDPIYTAHSYHTKIPYKAIMRYILHYTEPGDVVLDGFAGSGMTGVAAQLCGEQAVIESLGYTADSQGVIHRIDGNGGTSVFSRLGARWAILNDLSPAATFIAYHYNRSANDFKEQANRILDWVQQELGWMYETMHVDGKTKGWVNHIIWSDVFACPACSQEIVFWQVAVDESTRKICKSFPCPHCHTVLEKRLLEPVLESRYDRAINQYITQVKQIPVLINYTVDGNRLEKIPDEKDLNLIKTIEDYDFPYWFPTDPLPQGHSTRQPRLSHGLTHAHHFYTRRALMTLAAFAQEAHRECLDALWVLTAVAEGSSRLNRERPWGLPSKLSGTLYVSALTREINVLDFMRRKLRRYPTVPLSQTSVFCQCGSATDLGFTSDSIDYIFTDPPFGGNLMYSELNFLWESWIQIFTNNKTEAIENKVQGKGLPEYRELMMRCFEEYYRVLKPGRWITIVFHNSKNAVWNALQQSLQEAGFLIADVSALDKKQGTFKQVTGDKVIKQNLVVSAFKPTSYSFRPTELEYKEEEWVWEFIQNHLGDLPVLREENGKMADDPERKGYQLYDRLVAFCVEHSISVPISAGDFYAGLSHRYPQKGGMYFLSSQLS